MQRFASRKAVLTLGTCVLFTLATRCSLSISKHACEIAHLEQHFYTRDSLVNQSADKRKWQLRVEKRMKMQLSLHFNIIETMSAILGE